MNHLLLKHTLIFLAALLLAPLAVLRTALPSAKPNVIFILADDMGWGDPQCFGW